MGTTDRLDSDKIDQKEEKIDLEEDSDDEDEEKDLGFSDLPEETKVEAEERMKKYIKKDSDTWIEKFMKSNDYSIKDNEGGGDCLFAVIRDGLNSVGKKTSVSELRKLVSTDITMDTFESYRINYVQA